MKCTLSKTVFFEKLSVANKFVSDRLTTLNVLKGAYLKSEGGKLHIYATNLNMFYHSSIEVLYDEECDVIVDTKKIIEFLQLLLPGDIDVMIDEKNITISQGKVIGTFPVLSADDFPLPPVLLEDPQEIDAQFLIEKLPFILFTASTDDSRPILSGVNFVLNEDELLIVSTDGFRLSICKQKGVGSLRSMIIPAEFLRELLQLLNTKGKVIFTYSAKERIVSFGIGETTLYTRLIEGEFPPFERVIPTENACRIEVKRSELLRNTKIVSLFARESSNIIIYDFVENGIQITPKKSEGVSNTAFQEAIISGTPQRVAFNFRFIIDFLNHAKSEYIQIEVLRSDAPVVLKEKGNDSFMHIIMPVRIQD